jgi:hypothetical protein
MVEMPSAREPWVFCANLSHAYGNPIPQCVVCLSLRLLRLTDGLNDNELVGALDCRW